MSSAKKSRRQRLSAYMGAGGIYFSARESAPHSHAAHSASKDKLKGKAYHAKKCYHYAS